MLLRSHRPALGIRRAAVCGVILAMFASGGDGRLRGEEARAAVGGSSSAATADFARDIYPLLRRACFECHAGDQQQGGLRLDTREGAFESDSMIVPGQPEASELVRRISLPHGDSEIMPAIGQPLPPSAVERIRSWIADGAAWPEKLELAPHWAYQKPVRPPVPLPLAPSPLESGWPRNEIDAFVLTRLEQSGTRPSPEAAPEEWARRLYLDLTGLPPAPAELDAFLNDPSDDAYERLVDRLLAEPAFGERWARPWLDLARYADSHGFQRDDLRDLWDYRDWVIDALNADMPFDQFTVEQIAGDLIPGASESQRIATGFHRAAPINVEAGSIPEETRVNQIIDRVNTTATVWLGTTLECAQCHDHKYDPFSQREYFQLFAFFNSTEIEAERQDPKVPSSIAFVGPTMPLTSKCRDVDQGMAALVRDLKQRGMLDDTLVIWGSEFGRTPLRQGAAKGAKAKPGRDHHKDAFTIWLAGGGVKRGFSYGTTNDFGFDVVDGPVHVHDLNATVLHLLGLDHERLTYKYQGREFRLTDVHGRVVTELLA
ncbi:DUF1549 domain-containing protein [Candidatus Laterigemmans baculatus]|uniref:DUF1549 domain-containing protein n=1 Tax=Candidatus Laterigemmans baculatus TaxID=2770505 RepID=UPI0013DBE0D7|nr:DUF1549 domain-containing protein [Candidatus Laterigemmans baculatus]